MNLPAAIEGTYADLKLIRGRKVAVICIEIPLERAEDFVAAFGMPDPGAEKWVAVARLNPNAAKATGKPKEPHDKRRLVELPPAQQAALVCQRAAFWRYLNEEIDCPFKIKDEGTAAECVRVFCGVASRSELATNPKARERWSWMLSAFEAWLTVAA